MEFSTRIKTLRQEKGWTQEELGKRVGMQRPAICKYEKGMVQNISATTIKKFADAFGVTPSYMLGYTDTRNKDDYPSATICCYNVIGTVRAGYGQQAVEEYTGETEYIPTELLRGLPKEDYFVLEVKGDSMYPKLLDGDRVLVQRTDSVDSGSIAIVLYDGDEATIKKVVYENGCDWVDLIPLNSKYQPKRISGTDLEQCRILGKVVNLTRKI